MNKSNLKKVLALLCLSSFITFSASGNEFRSESGDKQFPDPNQVYVPGKDIGFSKYLTRSLYGSRKIALTFDDGPDVYLTPTLLDTLKKYDVKATFFILTERINERTLPIIKRMIDEGHTLASHHHDHVSNDSKTEAAYRQGLKKSVTSIASLNEEYNGLNQEVYYRFPYGAYGSKKLAYHHLNVMKDVSEEIFRDNCINFVFWDIDTADWVGNMTSEDIAQNVMANIVGGRGFNFKKDSNGKYVKVPVQINKPIGGGVVLMHDVHKRTVDSVPLLLERLKQERVEVISLQEIKEFSYEEKVCRLVI